MKHKESEIIRQLISLAWDSDPEEAEIGLGECLELYRDIVAGETEQKVYGTIREVMKKEQGAEAARNAGDNVPCDRLPKPGERFEWRGISFVALGMEQGGLLAITEKPTADMAFDEAGKNDWRVSTLREYLNGEWLENLGRDGLLPFTSDLTSDDGLKDYGTAEDYVFLLSADLYRKYRAHIPNQDDWWWLLTPWTISPSHADLVRSSGSDGSLYSDSVSFTSGVVAGLLFNPESFLRARPRCASGAEARTTADL